MGNQKKDNDILDKITSFAKRRGFIYPGSEIYGGLAGFYDFGPLGVELKFNIKEAWWRANVRERDDVVGLSAALIMNPRAWEASGHVSGFSDQLMECKKCHFRFDPDKEGVDKYNVHDETATAKGGTSFKCPNSKCGGNKFTQPKKFNLMFKTFVGSTEDNSSVAYFRPETAGGIFVNFKNVLDTTRVKIPFGIAQIGRAFRNEINPRDYIFRMREFEQMELEYFVRPKEAKKAFKEWVTSRMKWYKALGLTVREHEQSKEERAHYSQETTDIEYEFPFGWQEIEGIANRGDFDLQAHMKASGKDLSYFDEETKERLVPHVIEPSAGVERIFLAVLCSAYTEEEDRVVLKLHPRLAPYKIAVFPLLANKPELVKCAEKIYKDLKKEWMVAWDDRGNIGKRYRAQDEAGTPYCITVDFESLEEKGVTVRERDSMKQERVKITSLRSYFEEKLFG